MSELLRRGQASSQVSDWHVSSDEVTAPTQQSFFVPHGLTLQQTITSSGSVTIPAGVNWVYVIMTGAGRGSFFGYSGNAGEVSWGWTLAQNTCIIGAGVAGGNGGYTRYGHIIARGGPSNLGATNYYGIPGGAGFGDGNPQNGQPGSNGGGGGGAASGTAQGGNGGNGISGGSAGMGNATTGTSTGGNGGSGLAGGGGGRGGGSTAGTRTGGNGGNGIGIDGTIYTGGTGSSNIGSDGAGGGGAGIAGNGGNASGGTPGNGGLGGGGSGSGTNGAGGNGILYIYY